VTPHVDIHEYCGARQPAKVTPFAGGNEAASEKGPQAAFSN
jgi:hypothetical protein